MCLSSSSPSTLLSEAGNTNPRLVRCLYCSTSPMPGSYKTKTQQSQIWDMCCVQHKDKRLLITTCGLEYGIQAYNTANDKIAWKVKGKLAGMEKDFNARGLATDGRGRLFVLDCTNSCIQIFKTDGSYMGVLFKFEHNPQSSQWRIRWCNSASSLVITRIKDDHYHLGVFKVSSTEDSSVAENLPMDLNLMESVPTYKWEGISDSVFNFSVFPVLLAGHLKEKTHKMP